MKITRNPLLLSALVLALLFVASCKTSKIASEQTILLDTLEVRPEKALVYRSSPTKTIDILHTKLKLSFNWDSAFVHGEAYLIFKPHFYSTSEAVLNARGFIIEEVALMNGEEKSVLKYEYNGSQLHIDLGKEYQGTDSLEVYVKYTAKPNKLEVNGSSAITEDKGLYFINERGLDPNKPRQLWTQGETEANSGWFPTVDKPNEKFTTEIYVTIEEEQTSISNGLKMFSVSNGDGTKTEYWKMDKPHSAYLVMLAVGPFAQYEDTWNDMEVNYFLDSAYLPYAKDIFGNTPEMMTFYSDYLGVPYPWQKYDQVVVHDYVSGAMENTTATIHGEFLQQTKREMIDGDNEDVIAHELFHHWFGDLVTCESWSNLTLNEGFATYGEYLWQEYKYGRAEADFNFSSTKAAYLRESEERNVDLIRFYYRDKEDMFDSHSYAKGGLILHMLRKYVGDAAFRASLQYYLTKHAYQNVEVHDLRMAFEEVTGEDLNWFFNQWFLSSGNPLLDVQHSYADGKLFIFVEQKQDIEQFPLYRLPVQIEYVSGGKKSIETYVIDQQKDTVIIQMSEKALYVNFNPGQAVLSETMQTQSIDEWIEMYKHTDLEIDKQEALEHMYTESNAEMNAVIESAKASDHWFTRLYAMRHYVNLLEQNLNDSIKNLVIEMTQTDPHYGVRYNGLYHLNELYDDKEMTALSKKAMSDSSIMVESIALRILTENDPVEAGKEIDKMQDFEYAPIASAAAEYYTDYGSEKDHSRLIDIMGHIDGYYKYQIIQKYGAYIERCDHSILEQALPVLKDYALNSDPWWIQMAAIQEITKLHYDLKESMKEDESVRPYFEAVDSLLFEVKEKETNQRLISLIDNYLAGKKPDK